MVIFILYMTLFVKKKGVKPMIILDALMEVLVFVGFLFAGMLAAVILVGLAIAIEYIIKKWRVKK